jgi:capsular polysaccharide transport system permease protein
VRLLRKKGIDPFQRSNMLELVVPSQDRPVEQPGAVPQTVPRAQLPSTEVIAEDSRAREIIKMQRDIVRRRRKKLMQLATRLAFFVLLPTFIAGYYFFVIATPMFATKSEFVIQQAQPSMGGGSGLSGLFSGTSLATSQDSIAVQGYLQSVDAMLRLESDTGFIAHFSQPEIDPLQRLEAGATQQDAYKVFKNNVKISYDPTEGIIKMEVIAGDPLISQRFSEHLISYAEEQVDNLTQRLRADQMQGARESFEQAEANMLAAQLRVLELQERLGVLDPTVETQAIMTQVATFETQLQEKRLQLQQLLDNQRPNQARVAGVQGDIRRLEDLIANLRAQLTENSSTTASLASVSGQLRLAETDLQTRQLMMTQALQQMETARIEANRQTRYLSMAVSPIAPEEPTYPRAFENTVLAFLIFGGIYLMISLTASILREQVSG